MDYSQLVNEPTRRHADSQTKYSTRGKNKSQLVDTRKSIRRYAKVNSLTLKKPTRRQKYRNLGRNYKFRQRVDSFRSKSRQQQIVVFDENLGSRYKDSVSVVILDLHTAITYRYWLLASLSYQSQPTHVSDLPHEQPIALRFCN